MCCGGRDVTRGLMKGGIMDIFLYYLGRLVSSVVFYCFFGGGG